MTAPTPAPAPACSATSPAAAVDWKLVQRTLAGEPKAFDMLVIKYQRRIERLVARIVRDPNTVPDIAQETFINAYKALHQFRGDAQFYTWLYRIAVNTARHALAQQQRNPTVNASALLADAADSDETFLQLYAPSSDETPEAILAAKEIAHAVSAALEQLPDDQRQAITLREIEGMRYEEIAQAMHTPVGTVRSRIFRAREAIAKKLRPMLEQRSGKRW